MTTNSIPACPSCGTPFEVGKWWGGSNYCLGLFMLDIVANNPGLSAWELSQRCTMDYANVSKGLNKLRDFEVIQVEPEERTQGGIRYRYFGINEPARERFEDSVRTVEAYEKKDRKKKAYWAERKRAL